MGSRNKFSLVAQSETLGNFFNLHKCKMATARYVSFFYTRTGSTIEHIGASTGLLSTNKLGRHLVFLGSNKFILKKYYVKRREEGHVLRRMSDALVPGKRWRGRQKTRWKDLCNRDMDNVGLKVDRTKWKTEIQTYSGDPR